jgi:glutaredoxin
MKRIKVSGKNKEHMVVLYALSTCAWCKRMKKFLKNNDVEYEYIDVDLETEEERQKIQRFVLSYPLTIIDKKILIDGYKENKIKEALGI